MGVIRKLYSKDNLPVSLLVFKARQEIESLKVIFDSAEKANWFDLASETSFKISEKYREIHNLLNPDDMILDFFSPYQCRPPQYDEEGNFIPRYEFKLVSEYLKEQKDKNK